MSDADRLLVRKIREGDSPAWMQFIERYQGRLIAFVESRLRDRSHSEDVVQETFVGFLTSLPNFDENRDLEAYLFSIASYKLTDHLRRQGRNLIQQIGSDESGRPLDQVPGMIRAASSVVRSHERRDAEERMLAEALSRLVREWIAKRDYTRLKCLELLIVCGWANKDAARALGITEQAVASFKFQTLAKLKESARRAGLNFADLGGE